MLIIIITDKIYGKCCCPIGDYLKINAKRKTTFVCADHDHVYKINGKT